ncbi:GTPase-activating protein gyp8 [Coemansia guatemalensis]|uniref:GTPase-activating protein gyp8 n=1 Tax=Coemansia guatemalensis TaxID=2761395 RepID=A0A9W8I0V4_9FUNG|nr:GTPase-activating protein gyp8 [Coemansia guatemalensis]
MGSKGRTRRRKQQQQQHEEKSHAIQAVTADDKQPVPRATRIAQAVTGRDLTELKRLARTGDGLQTTAQRRQAWPLLLNFRSLTGDGSGGRNEAHQDEPQVELDVKRTSLPASNEIRRSEAAVRRRQAQLQTVVQGVLRSHPWLRYYQGFHELALTFLCVFGSERPATEAARMAALFFVRDAMGSGLEDVMQQLQLLYVLLEQTCPAVHELLVNVDVPPFFAISWVLTWFAHDVDAFADICRIYDFLIVSPPMQVVYMAAAMVAQNQHEILAYEHDFASIHSGLVALPKTIVDWLPVIEESDRLQREYPATRLQLLGNCRLPRLSAVSTYEATWKRLDPARPLPFASLVPVRDGHPLADPLSHSEKPESGRMARVIDATHTAQRARELALQHRWPLVMATVASATMLVYAWIMTQQTLP